jgi:hypothetical protein
MPGLEPRPTGRSAPGAKEPQDAILLEPLAGKLTIKTRHHALVIDRVTATKPAGERRLEQSVHIDLRRDFLESRIGSRTGDACGRQLLSHAQGAAFANTGLCPCDGSGHPRIIERAFGFQPGHGGVYGIGGKGFAGKALPELKLGQLASSEHPDGRLIGIVCHERECSVDRRPEGLRVPSEVGGDLQVSANG